MGNIPFTEEIKTRVPAAMKEQLLELAAARDLDLSDVVREALREYLAKRTTAAPPVAATSQLQVTGTDGPRE